MASLSDEQFEKKLEFHSHCSPTIWMSQISSLCGVRAVGNPPQLQTPQLPAIHACVRA